MTLITGTLKKRVIGKKKSVPSFTKVLKYASYYILDAINDSLIINPSICSLETKRMWD